jgi:CheY-like chemotaxis protein
MNVRHDDAARSATLKPSSDGKRTPQVLVVDDAKEIRETITIILRASGYGVFEANDGLAAQAILMNQHLALVICDLEMPIGDGWELLKYCHAHCPNIPVMIMSGSALGRQPAIECWAAAFLPKPFNVLRFRTAVEQLVSRAA